MKKLFFISISCIACQMLQGQVVGINTLTPKRTLSVNGSIRVDNDSTNYGTLDSAALLLGNGVGLFSNKMSANANYNGMDFWTNNTRRMVISSSGAVGINLGNSLPAYYLDVNGSMRTSSTLYANALSVTSGGSLGGNLTVAGKSTVNGNLQVDGTASVGGKGIVRSNSATNLRMGFTSGAYAITLPAGNTFDITFNITPFDGTNSNIRVSICQFVPNAGTGDTWGRITMTVHSVDAAANQCKIRFFNGSGATATMDGTLYLMSVATD